MRSSVAIVLLGIIAGLAANPVMSQSRLGPDGVWGPQYGAQSRPATPPGALVRPGVRWTNRVRYWNEVAINASGVDHTPVAEGEDRVFGEQLGPGRSSCAMAIVHIAIFEAVNAIAGGYRSYVGLARTRPSASVDAAIAQAAHDTLIALFPSQKASFDQTRDPRRRPAGIEPLSLLISRGQSSVNAPRIEKHDRRVYLRFSRWSFVSGVVGDQWPFALLGASDEVL